MQLAREAGDTLARSYALRHLVGLIYTAAAQERRDEAEVLVEEARAIAGACGAERIVLQVEEARAQIGIQPSSSGADRGGPE